MGEYESSPGIDPEIAKLPLPERVTHRQWKVREAAYQELKEKFASSAEDSKVYSDFAQPLSKAVRDTNAAVQLSALDCLQEFVQMAPMSLVKRITLEVAKGITEKSFTGRAQNRKKGIDSWVSLVGADVGDLAVEGLCTVGLKHKTPKVIVGSLDAVKVALESYGRAHVPCQAVRKHIGKLLDHSNAQVRAATKGLIIEMHRWMGKSVEPLYKGVKDVTVKELEAGFAKHTEKPVPLKKTRSQIARKEAGANSEGSGDEDEDGGVGDTAEEEVDLRQEVNVMELLPTLKVNIEEGVQKPWAVAIESKKWKARKDALEVLVESVGDARLTPGPHIDLIVPLRRIFAADKNVTVVERACRVVSLLATGLRSKFPPQQAKDLTKDLMARLKEKNRALIRAVNAALDALFENKCIELHTLVDDISNAASHKVPKARLELLLWLGRCLEAGIPPSTLKGKPLEIFARTFVKLSEDSAAEARDASLNCIAFLVSTVGERQMKSHLEMLDKIRREKVTALMAKIPPRKPVREKPKKEKVASSGSRAREVRKDQQIENSTEITAPVPKPEEFKPVVESEPDANPKEAIESAVQKLEEFQLEDWSAKQANVRTSAADKLMAYLETQENIQPTDVNMALGLLLTDPGLNDTNFRAVKAKLDVLGRVAQKCERALPKEALEPLLATAVAKLGDIKFAIATTSVLMSVAEAASARFVFATLASAVPNAKNARAQTAMLDFGSKLVQEFGVPAVPSDNAVALASSMAMSETAAVRKAALALAAQIAVRTKADGVREILSQSGLASEHLTSFENECSKFSQGLEGPTRKEKHWPAVPTAPSKSSADSGSEMKVESSTVVTPPAAGDTEKSSDIRVPLNISKEVTKTPLVCDLGSRNWKVRQNALAALDDIVNGASNGIDGEVGPDLIPALKERLSDSNRNLAAYAYSLLGRLVSAMGDGAIIHAEAILPTVFGSGCIDIKPRVREAALKCLEAWCTCIGLVPMLPYLAMPTSTISSVCRKDYLEWLLPWLRGEKGNFSSRKEDLSILVDPCLSCLRDKIGQVRQLAEWVLEQVVLSIGFPPVEARLRSFSKSVRLQLEPALDKFRGLNDPPLKKESLQTPRRKTPGGPKVKGARARRSGMGAEGRSPNWARVPSKSPKTSSSTASHSPKAIRASNRGRLGVADVKSPRGSSPDSSGNLEKPFRSGGNREERVERVRRYREEQAPDGISESDHFPFIPETLSLLRVDLEACVSVVIFKKMMAPPNRFQQHADAVSLLNEAMQGDPDGVVPVADVLIRWAAYRINDIKTPSTLIIKISDLVKNICEVLQSNGTRLTDYEALAIVPVLADRCGSNREPVRTAALSALQSVEDLLDEALALVYLAEGMRLTRNFRAKVVVAGEVEELMSRIPNEDDQLPASVLQGIAEVAAGVDEIAGCAAARCIDRAHQQFGDDILTMLGPLSDDQVAIIQGRLDSVSGVPQSQMSAVIPQHPMQMSSPENFKNGALPSPAAPVQVRSEDFRLSIAPSPPRTARNFGKFAHNKNLLETPIRTRRQLAVELLHDATPVPNRPLRHKASPVRRSTGASESNAQTAINLLKSSERSSCAQGLEILFEDLNQTHSELLSNRASEVIPLLCRGFRDCFERLELHSAPSDEPSLLKRYLNALMSFARIPEVIQGVQQSVIEGFLNDLLDTLVPPDIPDVVDWERVRRGINLVVLKILDFCDRNVLFSSLLNILLADLRMPREEEIIASAKSNLCLKSISKVVRRGFKSVDIDKLLRDVHLFITAYPPSRSLDGTSDQQQSLRLLKIILDSLIQFKGERIMEHLTLVPSDENTPLVRFIKALLNKRGLGKGSQGGTDLNTIRNLSATSPALFGPAKRAAIGKKDVGLQGQLRKIFQRIRTREGNDVGLRQLKAFMRAHPEVDVTPHIHRCSDLFQKYIREGLARISNEESTVEVSRKRTDNALEVKNDSQQTEDDKLSESNKSTGQIYLARLRDIQIRYGLTGRKGQKTMNENTKDQNTSDLKENEHVPTGT